MASFDALKVGDVLYSTRRVKAGNTTMSRTVVDRITVAALDDATRHVTTTSGKVVPAYKLSKWHRSPPEWISDPFDGARCHFCRGKRHEGHRDGCRHPKALRAQQGGRHDD